MNIVDWYLVPYTNLFYILQYTNLFLDIVKKHQLCLNVYTKLINNISRYLVRTQKTIIFVFSVWSWFCDGGGDISNPLVMRKHLKHLHLSVHSWHGHRHQAIFTYYRRRIKVMLPLQMQWTKLWCANYLNLTLIRGFSFVWLYLYFGSPFCDVLHRPCVAQDKSGGSRTCLESWSTCKLKYLKMSQP